MLGIRTKQNKNGGNVIGKSSSQPINVFGIDWPPKCVCLGVCFFRNSEISAKDNFEKKFACSRSVLRFGHQEI